MQTATEKRLARLIVVLCQERLRPVEAHELTLSRMVTDHELDRLSDHLLGIQAGLDAARLAEVERARASIKAATEAEAHSRSEAGKAKRRIMRSLAACQKAAGMK